MITVVLWIVLGLYGVGLGTILTTSVLITGVSFIVGDIFILPRFGNTVATVADFGLTLAMIWLVNTYLFEPFVGLGTASLISAFVIALGEIFFHLYMQSQVFKNEELWSKENEGLNQRDMLTEFGSEVDIKPVEKREKEE